MLEFEKLERLCEMLLDGGEIKVERKYMNSIIDNLICYEKEVKLSIEFNSINNDLVNIKIK